MPVQSPPTPPRHVLVIGGGVIGSAVAATLAARGTSVTQVADDAGASTPVSAASFAWVNAHDKYPDAYAALNEAGRAAHIRLSRQRPARERWFHRTGSTIGGTESPGDGYVDAAAFIAAQRADLVAFGGELRGGTRVAALRRDGATVVASTAVGDTVADAVVIAAGAGTAALAASIGGDLRRIGTGIGPRGFLARIRLDTRIRQVHSDGDLQLRPDGDGVLAVQCLQLEALLRERDEPADRETVWPGLRARLAARLGRDIPDDALIGIDEAERPTPADGLPVLGWIAERVYAMLTHSGMTLAPLLADLVTRDLRGDEDPRLRAYRPDTTTAKGTS